MNKKIFEDLKLRISSSSIAEEFEIKSFYDIFIMFPDEAIDPNNKYLIEYRTRHAGEVRTILNIFDQDVLQADENFTYKDRQDLFECFTLSLDYLLFDPYTKHQTKEDVLLEIVESFELLIREDIQTIRLYINRKTS